jgi:broad specificity phosphatase PhoE
MPKRYLYLIRNAQYKRAENSTEGTLTDAGERQAQISANALAHLPIQSIHCSPYEQVRQTAQYFADVCQVKSIETGLLRQYDSFAMEDGTLTRKQFLSALENQQQQLGAAFVVFVQPPPAKTDYHEIVVCHANIIRDLICKGINVNPATWAHIVINHCGISTLSIDDHNTVELLTYNETNHLPDSLKTE